MFVLFATNPHGTSPLPPLYPATRTVAEAIAQTLARYAAEDSAKAADTTAAASPLWTASMA